jgi:gluconolactonase
VTPAARRVIARLQTRPNGIALSPNGNILYVANTDEKNIRAYDVDRDGRVSNERVAVANLGGGPDGMRVDVSGNLYVAAGGVEVYSPDGKLLGKIAVPVNPRNLAFGDADMKTLYLVQFDLQGAGRRRGSVQSTWPAGGGLQTAAAPASPAAACRTPPA